MIEEDMKLEPLMAVSNNFTKEFRSQVIPSIQTALLKSSELEVTDRASWMDLYMIYTLCTWKYATKLR